MPGAFEKFELKKVCRPCCVVFCYYSLEQGLSAGDRKTRYSRKSGHGRPDEGLAGTRDKWAKNRDVPVKSGRVATLCLFQNHLGLSIASSRSGLIGPVSNSIICCSRRDLLVKITDHAIL